MDLNPVLHQPLHGPLRRAAHLGALAAATAALAGCVIAPARYPHGPYPPPAPQAQSLPPMYFYPERGQPEGLQDRDRYECYRLAVRDSGVDPGMTPTARAWTPPPARRDGVEVINGAATGAVLGAAVSSHRHAGENAVIGAIFGAMLGAVAQESRAQAVEAAQARQAAAARSQQVPLDNFRRAMGACMQSRGYTVG